MLPTLEALVEQHGVQAVLLAFGLAIGLAFGFLAQRSRFCLRSATIEFSRQRSGGRLTVWLFAFGGAIVFTQALVLAGAFDSSQARQIAARGSLSGAALGGALFGAGMILARGCASRLLVLAGQGNLRSMLSGLVFAVTALAATSGALAPLRLALGEAWTVPGGGDRDLLARFGAGHGHALAFGLVWLIAAVFWARRQRVSAWGWAGALGVGATVAAAWWATAAVARASFEPLAPQSLTFAGPSAEVLSRVLVASERAPGFEVGLVAGVFAGSFIAALLFRELRVEAFEGAASMQRALAGAVLMGFGATLAGGCAVGAGLTGASVFTVTAWVALAAMWAAAALTDRLVDAQGPAPPTVHPQRPLHSQQPHSNRAP